MNRKCVYGAWLAGVLWVLVAPGNTFGLDHVTWRDGERERQVDGRVIVEAADGGLLFQGRDGALWTIQPEDLIARTTNDAPFTALQGERLERQLLDELGRDFEVHRTAHYTLVYNTSPEYARWCAGLYERLYASFYNFWRTRGLKLRPPELPLVAVVFRDKASYVQVATREVGPAAESIVGYYSLQSNRIYTYDLTGADETADNRRRRTQMAHIQQILMRPQAVPLVSTLIHEATHQLSYNSGLQSRYVDNPLWVSEGLAMYFETPDRTSDKGWRTLGQVNAVRLHRFRQYLPNRPDNSLDSLLQSDERMRTGETAVDAYAESWAFCYFLIRIHPDAFVEYLKELAARPPLSNTTTEERIATFERCLGMPTTQLDQEFLRFVTRLDEE